MFAQFFCQPVIPKTRIISPHLGFAEPGGHASTKHDLRSSARKALQSTLPTSSILPLVKEIWSKPAIIPQSHKQRSSALIEIEGFGRKVVFSVQVPPSLQIFCASKLVSFVSGHLFQASFFQVDCECFSVVFFEAWLHVLYLEPSLITRK